MLLMLLACGRWVTTDTPTLPQSGYTDVTFTLHGFEAESVSALTVGGVAALNLRRGDGVLTAMVQGSPTPGQADAVFFTDIGQLSFDGPIVYEATPYPELERVVAIGASLTMGFQAAGLTPRETLMSPPARIARATGAWIGLPVMVPELLPPLTAGDVGPGCRLPAYTDHLVEVVPGLFEVLTDGSGLNFAQGRQDPALQVTNLGVAGSDVNNLLQVPDDAAEEIFAHLVYGTDSDLGDPLLSQVELAESMNPTVILVIDALGNHIIDPLVADDPLSLDASTPPEDLRAPLRELLERLDATGARVYFGNEIPLSASAFAQNALEDAIAAGYTAEEAQSRLDALDARCDAYNALLLELSADLENIVVVDLAASVRDLAANGVEVGGEHLTVDRLGGLTSLDGVHFSSMGYALLANEFLAAMDADFGVGGAQADPAEGMDEDPASPAALRAAGLERCE